MNEELISAAEELRIRNHELLTLTNALQEARTTADRAREYADAIINTVSEPLVVLDDTLTVMRVNQSFCTEFELRCEQIEGRPLARVAETQWDVPLLLKQLQEVLTRDIALTDFELPYTVPRRSPRNLLLTAHKIPGDTGRVSLILLSVEDVTERRASAQRLEQMDQRKDEFLAMLAHELRNPLSAITQALHLLRHHKGGTDPTPLYDLIQRQTRQLVHLIDDLLDVARIRRGHIELKREAVNLVPLVRGTVWESSESLKRRRHTLTLELPEAPLEVEGDPIRLEQIVSNLLENAIKYTEPGGRIMVSLSKEAGEIALSVRDNGIGIRAQDLEGIFDLFTQIDTTLARSDGGLGIGLTVVHRLVALHAGRIEARSAGLGRGSEFIVRLPIASRTAHWAPQPKIESAHTTIAPSVRRVLIVEDNRDSAEALGQLVRSWGHEVTMVPDGSSALALFEHLELDIAFLDIGLPRMDGYELARRMRASALQRPLRLVAMTGYGREEDRRTALDAGFDAHFVKPLTIEAIRQLLTESAAADDTHKILS